MYFRCWSYLFRPHNCSYRWLMVYCWCLLIFSMQNLWAPLASRRETLPQDRKLAKFCNPSPKIWEALPPKIFGPKTCKIWRNFGQRQTLIWNEWKYPELERRDRQRQVLGAHTPKILEGENVQNLIVNLSRVDKDIDKQKVTLSTTTPLTFDGKILVNFWSTNHSIRRLMFTHPKSTVHTILDNSAFDHEYLWKASSNLQAENGVIN